MPPNAAKQVNVSSLPLQGFNIEKYSIHPDWDWATFNNDIALVR